MINNNIMHYLYEYLKGSFNKDNNIVYTYDIYNPFDPYGSFKKSENINKYLIQKLLEIDLRLKKIEEKIK
jgi:hypothetical protein